MKNNKILEISNSLKFDANEKVISQIKDLYFNLEKQIELMKLIDTKNVEPMTRVDNNPINFLREDIVGEHLAKDLILKNASSSDKDFVVINKGDSND